MFSNPTFVRIGLVSLVAGLGYFSTSEVLPDVINQFWLLGGLLVGAYDIFRNEKTNRLQLSIEAQATTFRGILVSLFSAFGFAETAEILPELFDNIWALWAGLIYLWETYQQDRKERDEQGL